MNSAARPMARRSPPVSALVLGVRQNKVYWFKGAIAEVRFHDTALPDEQLQRVSDRAR